MAAVTVALVGFFAFLMLRVTAPQMTPLFTDLSMQDSATIVKDLERQGIPYEIKNDGATVLVPKDQVPRVRMKLAETGLPRGGGVGYEIFDKSDTLGATSFIQNINHLRALEGELARTIRALHRVEMARVHLVLPERPLFSRDKVEPSASIVLKVRGSLESQQVRAIRHLVASAVSGLKPERVSVVDEAGRLLADGAAADSGVGGSVDERQVAHERRLRDQIESIVSSVVGPGHARATPGAGQNGGSARDQSRKSEEIVNYEISRTTKTEVIEGGRVKRISVGVLVDGIYAKNDKGEPVYEPRSKDEIDRIAALVRSTIGFDQKRGDVVEVVNLRFAEQPAPMISEPADLASWLQFTKDDVMRGVELVVMALLGLIVVLFVVRPLVRRIITPDARAIASAAAPALTAGPAAASAAAVPPMSELPVVPSQAAKMIDIAQVQGQVHAQSVHKVGELASRNPNETVSIIRQWLQDTPAA